MKTPIICALSLLFVLSSCKKEEKARQPESIVTTTIEPETENDIAKTETSALKISPIDHATMVLEYENEVLYIDPVGGKEAFDTCKTPTMVVITDIHYDHLDLPTLEAINNDSLKILAPKAVFEKLTADLKAKTTVIANGETKTLSTLSFEAIPMYNLRKEALHFHDKGRGNGYVITFGQERIYISGDTEDIPEMRALKNIDKAFVCMNLPWTMPVDNASNAVLEFKPKQIYPYHYRNQEGFSDVAKFKMLINSSSDDIEVVQLDWYKGSDVSQ